MVTRLGAPTAALEIEAVEVGDPGANQVRIAVEAFCLDFNDVDTIRGRYGLLKFEPPFVIGMAAAGTVEATGEGVTKFAKGDRVTFDSTVYCGECPYCKRGQINLCDNREVIGVSCGDYRRHGAFAEYVVIPERIMYALPDNLSFNEAAMLEAVSVAMHGVKVSPVVGGETALVIGAGMIGLFTLQAARAAGCARVFIADVDATRLKLAREIGADEVLHCSGAELVAETMRLTNGRGVDLALEAVGRNETVGGAIDCTRKGGTVTLIGNIMPEVTLPLQKVVVKQMRLQGSCASSGEYPEAIELISAGKIQVKPLITAVAGLDDGPRWFERLHAREPNLMKIILTPRL